MTNFFDEKNPTLGDSWYRMQAKQQFHNEGLVEIDENAPVSQADGNSEKGAYVQAWIWISDPEVDELGDGESSLDGED